MTTAASHTILLTRPHTASEQWAALLAEVGFASVIDPLLIIEPTYVARPRGKFVAVIFTSANAVASLKESHAHMDDLILLPCFCVGAATGRAAHRAGFLDVHEGASDGLTLAHLLTTDLAAKCGHLLHIAGDIVKEDMERALRIDGFTFRRWSVYRALAREGFGTESQALLREGKIDAIPVFSARSAQLLVAALEKNHLEDACRRLIAVALSQAVANVLETISWRRLCVAEAPSESQVLALLQSELK